MSTHYDQTIAELESEIREMEDEIIQSKRMVNRLCAKAGRDPAFPPEQLKAQDATATMRTDLYYLQPLATAMKDVLVRRKASNQGPASVNTIYETLIKGGYKFETESEENAKRGLRISLRKNADFHKLPAGDYGLTEWYPKAKPDSGNGESARKGADDVENDDLDDATK